MPFACAARVEARAVPSTESELVILRSLCFELPRRSAAWFSDRWYDARLFWYTANKGLWALAAVAVAVVAALAFVLQGIYASREDRRNLACLAQNIYFEARGEPLAGQYAVAEVTLNRRASGRYPDTVCGVVYQRSWDVRRQRYVGAFSWTELSDVAPPTGAEWQQAMKIAEDAYYHREPSALDGALYYHAVQIKPAWARNKQPIARIGRHVFYR